MQPAMFSSLGFFSILLVCWVGAIDAIPFGSYAPEKAPQEWKAWKRRSAAEQTESIGSATEFSLGNSPHAENSDYNFNNNVNVNEVYPDIMRPDMERMDSRQEDSKENDGKYENDFPTHSSNSSNVQAKIPDVGRHVLKYFKNARNKEDPPKKCSTSLGRDKNADNQHLPRNRSSMNLLGAFEDVGKLEAIKTSSIHTGGDMTLCWIETTTIKEDRTFRPPKRLVIKEFTISMENSATISEDDIQCSQMDGEILPGDERAVCETSFREYIEEDTSQSRVVNFTKVSHVGPISIRQEKKIKCAMGRVVLKDIYKWPDGSDNPRQRVEIKISPTIRNVPSDACAPKNVWTESEEERSSPFVSDCASSGSCEIVGPSEGSEEFNQPISPEVVDSSTPSLPHEPDEADDYLCTKYGICAIDQTAVSSGEIGNENCSDEDCTQHQSSELVSDSSDVEIEDFSNLPIEDTFIEATTIPAVPDITLMTEIPELSFITTDESHIDYFEIPTGREMETWSESSLIDSTTEVIESNEVIASTTTIPSCIGSQSKDCQPVLPKHPGLWGKYKSIKGGLYRPPQSMLNLLTVEEDSDTSESESDWNDDVLTIGASMELPNSGESHSRSIEEYETTRYPVDQTVTTMMTVGTETEAVSTEAPTELLASIEDASLPDMELSAADDSVPRCPFGSQDGSGNCRDEQTEVTSAELAETTSSTRSCEISGNCDSENEFAISMEENPTPTPSNSIVENLEESSCDSSEESCDTSSSRDRSCGSDSSSGSCSGEFIDEATITTTEPTMEEVVTGSVPSINASQIIIASTLPSTTQRTERKLQIGLKITVSLERINDKKENEKLMELEKHLLLNEGPLDGGNHSLVWKLQSLNNSMNMETFKSIFNCSSLENFTEVLSHLTKFNQEDQAKTSLDGKSDPTVKGSGSQDWIRHYDSARKKREISVSKDGAKGDTDATMEKTIKGSLSGIDEDFQNGLGHVFQRISQEFDGPGTNEDGNLAKSSSSTILKVLTSSTDGRTHAQRRKREVVSVEELKHPLDGVEIDRWSKERFIEAANGGRVRRFLEFNILRNPTHNVRRIP